MSDLDIHIEPREQVTVVTLKGSVNMEGTPLVRNALRQAAAGAGGNKVLIDLEHLAFICSLGLGAFIEAHTQLHRHGGELALVNPQAAVMKVLRTTQLVRLFKIYESVNEALEIPVRD